MGCDPEPDLNIAGASLRHGGFRPTAAHPFPAIASFQRVSLQPCETKTAKLPLATNSLAYFDKAKGKFVVWEELVTLRIASSSADLRLEQ